MSLLGRGWTGVGMIPTPATGLRIRDFDGARQRHDMVRHVEISLARRSPDLGRVCLRLSHRRRDVSLRRVDVLGAESANLSWSCHVNLLVWVTAYVPKFN